MEWFKGTVEEAVTLSKSRNVIFVVFIDGKPEKSIFHYVVSSCRHHSICPTGKSDDSKQMEALVNNAEIASTLSNPARYLAIRINSQEDSYKQFAQICKWFVLRRISCHFSS